jgi:hypothetical protein
MVLDRREMKETIGRVLRFGGAGERRTPPEPHAVRVGVAAGADDQAR